MLKKMVLPALMVLGMSAHAADSDTKGLIGVGLGYTGTQYNEPGTNGDDTATNGGPTFNLKLGAESRFYRAFIDGSIWYADKYHTAGTIGGALQYLIHPTESFNIFLGINGGLINTINETDVDPYYGLDAGVNFDIADNLGIEVGARTAWTNNDTDDYVARQFYQGYVNAIFKFTGDY